ncbi:MAG: flagellar basal body rod protein FlgC [Arcobacteraceae bacterium]|nr:flagellar basal body rod protein FlgC [Arcobacteraceae bacterium]
MGFFDGYNVATSGMSAQRTRINVVSANIANAQTTHTENGGPYKKQNVVFEELLLDNVKNNNKSEGFGNTNTNNTSNLRGVGVKEILDTNAKPMMKYEPQHPDANKEGFVAYPNINPVIEMVDLIEAMRSYEANVAAFQQQKAMDTKTLDILKG